MTALKAATDVLRAARAAAQQERDQRPDLISGAYGVECAWAPYERGRMHDAVNAIRAERGLPPVPMEDIDRVDRLAAGHSDYSRKFAFYCAELAASATDRDGD
jgi:hypothetical protein